jgi:hypothetical protein
MKVEMMVVSVALLVRGSSGERYTRPSLAAGADWIAPDYRRCTTWPLLSPTAVHVASLLSCLNGAAWRRSGGDHQLHVWLQHPASFAAEP